ncbi:MAG: hypothetical protein Q7R93_01360 [bacterium]|nr:hypothetical protein [bacterium]
MTAEVTTKRLTLDMSVQEHRRLKTLASFHGVTMKDFLLSKVLLQEKPRSRRSRTDETAYLLKSPVNKRRLFESVRRTGKRNKSFGSLRELKHALGI